jgi:hypothetical protein
VENNPVWKKLEAADPEKVCVNSGASYDVRSGGYELPFFHDALTVYPKEREVRPRSDFAGGILENYGEHTALAAPAYLVHAEGRPQTDELIQPKNIPGGEIYRKGAHMLPLDALARTYRSDGPAFVSRAQSLGGRVSTYGDASVVLCPFPHLPVTIALWLADDEFDERADLFFDSSASGQFPPDVLWGIASVCVELMIRREV